MVLKLLRLTKDKNNRQKIGQLMLYDKSKRLFECYILEPFDSIKSGRYQLTKYLSPKFNSTVLLYDIKDKDGKLRYFEIHYGNFLSNTKGCQLTGETITDINKDGLYDVTNSKKTLEKLLSLVHDEIFIDVFENPSEFVS